jgi:hypothetical protein
MALDAFKTNGSSPPQRVSECVTIGCGARAHNHNPRPDFLIADHGSIFLLQPISDRALAWIHEHLPPDAPRFGSSVVVEHRFVADIVTGIRDDGLVVRN